MFKLRIATHEESTLKKVAVGSSLGDKPTPKKRWVGYLWVNYLLIYIWTGLFGFWLSKDLCTFNETQHWTVLPHHVGWNKIFLKTCPNDLNESSLVRSRGKTSTLIDLLDNPKLFFTFCRTLLSSNRSNQVLQ